MSQGGLERICGNCGKFEEFAESAPRAIEVPTGEKISAGQRNCSAGNVAWANCPCPTGQFEPKESTNKKTA